MKTKEQVLQHLMEVGYTKKAINKIMGFLIGKDLKTIDEQITYKIGENNFEYFMNWFGCNCENIKVKKSKKSKLEAYKEIVNFLMSNVKDVPVYWLGYLNEDIKTLQGVKLQNELLNNKAKTVLDDFQDPLRALEIWFGK